MTYSDFFFFNDTATTEIYTLSLHDALPIWHELGELVDLPVGHLQNAADVAQNAAGEERAEGDDLRDAVLAVAPLHVDRKSTRLNSSHANISYAVFCLKKKKK